MPHRVRKLSETDKQAEERRKAQLARNQALIELLNGWEHEDQQEQQETLSILMRSLDEDRVSARKLFAQT